MCGQLCEYPYYHARHCFNVFVFNWSECSSVASVCTGCVGAREEIMSDR